MADTHLNKLLDAAVEIRQSPDAVERAYMARQLVQCTLPHSDPVNMPLSGNGRTATSPSSLTPSKIVRLAKLSLPDFGFCACTIAWYYGRYHD